MVLVIAPTMISTCIALTFLFTPPWLFPPADLPAGRVNKAVLKKSEPQLLWCKLGDRMTIVDDATTPIQGSAKIPLTRQVLVEYPRGGVGSRASGAQFMVQLEPSAEYRSEYLVKFDEDFDFVKGGKLPGLAGGEATAGNKRPTGDGWTARYMWRDGGEAVLYLYHLDQRDRHGDDISLATRFIPGKWHRLTQQVRVNDPGVANGRIQVWFDGEPVLDRGQLRLRSGEAAPVDRFYFSTFFGGSGPQWAPSQDQKVRFAAFRVVIIRSNSEFGG